MSLRETDAAGDDDRKTRLPTEYSAGVTPPTVPGNIFDSFDDDLTWIIERLVERTGGHFGVVCRFLKDDDRGCILAHAKSLPLGPGNSPSAIIEALRPSTSTARTGPTRADLITECRLDDLDQSFTTHRILCLTFSPSASVSLVAAVFRRGRHRGFGPIHRAVANVLYPVLARYVQLWWMHRTERTRANAFRTALDLSDVGVILLNRNLEVLFENPRAMSIMAAGHGLLRKNMNVGAQSYDDGLRLQAALQQARQSNLVNQPGEVRGQRAPLLALRRGDAKRPVIVTVLGIERVAVDSEDPAVMLYVLDPSRDVRDLLAPLCSIYKFTDAESRLAYWLTNGLPLFEAANKMHIQEATARSYLKQIFCKTHTNRQTDLVRLLLSSLQRVNSRVELVAQ